MPDEKVSRPPGRRRRIVLLLGGLAVLGLFTVASWAVTTLILEETGGEKFCDSCHSMDDQKKAYLRAPHGGNNQVGFQAQCVDCHLPHDSPMHYLISKAKFGVGDVFAEFFGNPDKVNWAAMRAHGDEFVFDSGCLRCHARLLEATRNKPVVFKSHKMYFDGVEAGKDVHCVGCHFSVGHAPAPKNPG